MVRLAFLLRSARGSGAWPTILRSDLGVDVHVVTLKETGAIESQSERVFRERGIGEGVRPAAC